MQSSVFGLDRVYKFVPYIQYLSRTSVIDIFNFCESVSDIRVRCAFHIFLLVKPFIRTKFLGILHTFAVIQLIEDQLV